MSPCSLSIKSLSISFPGSEARIRNWPRGQHLPVLRMSIFSISREELRERRSKGKVSGDAGKLRIYEAAFRVERSWGVWSPVYAGRRGREPLATRSSTEPLKTTGDRALCKRSRKLERRSMDAQSYCPKAGHWFLDLVTWLPAIGALAILVPRWQQRSSPEYPVGPADGHG